MAEASLEIVFDKLSRFLQSGKAWGVKKLVQKTLSSIQDVLDSAEEKQDAVNDAGDVLVRRGNCSAQQVEMANEAVLDISSKLCAIQTFCNQGKQCKDEVIEEWLRTLKGAVDVSEGIVVVSPSLPTSQSLHHRNQRKPDEISEQRTRELSHDRKTSLPLLPPALNLIESKSKICYDGETSIIAASSSPQPTLISLGASTPQSHEESSTTVPSSSPETPLPTPLIPPAPQSHEESNAIAPSSSPPLTPLGPQWPQRHGENSTIAPSPPIPSEGNATSNSHQPEEHQHWGTMSLALAFPSSLSLVEIYYQIDPRKIPVLFYVVAILFLLSFSSSVISYCLRKHSEFKYLSHVLEKIGFAFAGIGFYIAISMTFPRALKWVALAIGCITVLVPLVLYAYAYFFHGTPRVGRDVEMQPLLQQNSRLLSSS